MGSLERGEQGDDNETGLKEGGGIEISTTVLHSRVMTCLGVLDRGKRGDDNETGLKEGGEIEMSTTVLSIHSNDNYNKHLKT